MFGTDNVLPLAFKDTAQYSGWFKESAYNDSNKMFPEYYKQCWANEEVYRLIREDIRTLVKLAEMWMEGAKKFEASCILSSGHSPSFDLAFLAHYFYHLFFGAPRAQDPVLSMLQQNDQSE